jgi:sec-independent protein translocase protein TatA
MIGPWQIAIVALIVILLFGRGKISGLMGELGSGITSFKKGLKAEPKEDEPKVIDKNDAIDGEVVKSSDKDKTDA